MKEKPKPLTREKIFLLYSDVRHPWLVHFMQIFGADERSSDTSAASVIYSGTVTWQKPDGTT